MPILTDGLLDICKRQPGDPVDSLAEYLFKRSLDVPYPDPTTYWEKKKHAHVLARLNLIIMDYI